MMFFITMVKGIRANTKGQPDHAGFKSSVMNDVHTKQREAAEKQWQQCTMNGAGQRSGNSQSIPIDLVFH